MENMADLNSRYKVRAKMQKLSGQGELLILLRDMVIKLLDNTYDQNRYDKVEELIEAMIESTSDTNKIVQELHDEFMMMNNEKRKGSI